MLDYDSGFQLQPQPGTDDVTGARNCSYGSSARGIGALISAVTSEGVHAWVNNPDRPTPSPPKSTELAGFPALQITVPLSEPRPNKCYILVDVHDGQYLEVFTSELGTRGPKGSAAYCAEAVKVAGMALDTIESTR